MPQLNYSIYQDRGVEGGIPNSRYNYHIVGTQGELVNKHTDIIPYGRFVQEATTGEITPLSGPGNTIVGLTVFNEQYEKTAAGEAGTPVDKPIAVLDYGELYAIAEVNVLKSDSVFTRHTAAGSPGTYDGIGRVRNDADTANADAVPNAKFLEDAAAGELVRVFFDANQ